MRIGDTIYLDHQATTPLDAGVWQEMTPYLAESFANPHSIDHAMGWAALQAVDDSAARLAATLRADPDEIVFTSGATEANNLALLGVGRRAAGGKRRRILVTSVEHKCVLAAARALVEQLGYTVDYLPVDSAGHVRIEALESALGDDVLLVSVMAVNNEIGTIQDLGRVSELVRSIGALIHCDAAQAPGAIDLGSLAARVDMLSLSAHKAYGPKGVGALYIRRELTDRIEPLIYGGGQQRNIRSGTVPVPLCVGMAAAVALFDSRGSLSERESLRLRCDRLVNNLTSLPWPVALNGPRSSDRHPGNANLRFPGFVASDILATVQPYLAASTGSACTSGIPESSHVLRAIGLSEEEAESSIRFSLGRHTTEADIDRATELIASALAQLANAAPASIATVPAT